MRIISGTVSGVSRLSRVGVEFEAIFEEECQKRGIKLFVLPPRSPKLNGHVERHRGSTPRSFTK